MTKITAALVALVELVQEVLRRLDEWALHESRREREYRHDAIDKDPGGTFADRFGKRVQPTDPDETRDVSDN